MSIRPPPTPSAGRVDVTAMLGGTLLVGLSGYLYLAIIGHGRFAPATAAALSATYLIGNVLGPGVFIALEQETSRVISNGVARRAIGSGRADGLRARARRMAAIGGGLGAATLLLLVGFAPLLLDRVFDGQVGLVAALALAVLGSAAVYLVRGLTGGQRRFRRYALTVLIDGAVRIVGCLTLVVAGSHDPIAYAVALCAGPGVAALLTARHSGPPDDVAARQPSAAGVDTPALLRLVNDVALLLVASVLAMAMANLAPVVVVARLPGDPQAAAGFASAVVLTRVPLLFMGTISALLLPRMTEAATVGDRGVLRSTMVRGLTVIGAIGLIAVIGTWAVGRPVVAILFGVDRDTMPTASLVWLTASAALFMAVQLLQPVLVASRRHRELVWAWVAGTLSFAACFLLPAPALQQGVLAQVIGPGITLTVQVAVVIRYLRVEGPSVHQISEPTDPSSPVK